MMAFVEDEELDVDEEDLSLLYFFPLLRRDEQERATFMDNLTASMKLWESNKNEDISAQKLLSAHLPTVLRLSATSPYRDVREKMSFILKELENAGENVPRKTYEGPSSFIPLDQSICYESQSLAMGSSLAAVQNLYEEAFLYDCRLSHTMQVLSYHPEYLSTLMRTLEFLMNGNGPLPLHIRNYIAILAASRHKCFYLVSIQEAEFLRNGGDQQWLSGLNFLPQKMLNLLTLNKMLAHQPWFVSPCHVKDILRSSESWSVSELAHAIVIMAHFHALAGFALGCGLNPEIDSSLGHAFPHSTRGESPNANSFINGNPALGLGTTPTDSEYTDSEPISPQDRPLISPPLRSVSNSMIEHYIETACQNGSEPLKKLADTIMEKLKTVRTDNSSSEEEPTEQDIQFAESVSVVSSQGLKNKVSIPTPVNLVKYLEDANFEHQDFTLSSAVTLRAREYSWEDHGYTFLTELYPEIGPILDEKFKTAKELTYRMVGNKKNIDTYPFREAIWYYLHSIKGIRHDDYHYRKVNQILDIGFKTYIRMVACFPEKVTNYDFQNAMSGLEYSEKVHVNMLVLEARLQAELIYALKAVMRYMKDSSSKAA